jgi:microcystin-dependent protein
MADQFLGEIRILGCNFAPLGWALCNGQILPITQNTALFSLLGTTYGGDGRSTFALPNLQGVAPLQQGQGPGLSLYDLGQTGGETSVTLSINQTPAHNHTVNCSTANGTGASPAGNIFAESKVGRQGESRYSAGIGSGSALNAQALSAVGQGLPHNNMPPYLTLNFCIALQGIFPSRP